MTPQAEALAALRDVVARLDKPLPLAPVEFVLIRGLVIFAISQVEAIAVLKRPRRARKAPVG